MNRCNFNLNLCNFKRAYSVYAAQKFLDKTLINTIIIQNLNLPKNCYLLRNMRMRIILIGHILCVLCAKCIALKV